MVRLVLAIVSISAMLTGFGTLSGCGAIAVDGVGGVAQEIWVEDAPPDDPGARKWRKNYYEPVILSSKKDAIRIKYLDVNPNAQHEQALQMMNDHCDGSYIETSRLNETGYTTVEAECTRATDSSLD